MAKSRNDILFRFLSDTKSLERGSKRASKSMGGVSTAAKRMGGALAAAYGAREIVEFGKDAITAATDYVESINAVEVSTGDAAEQILRLGDTAATAFGLSKIAINEAAVSFAAFGAKIAESEGGDLASTFEEFIGRATDFASVMNIEVDAALVKFQSGLAGETEPLRRFGIDISAAATKLFALENGIGEVGRELTETEKVQARYGLLLQQTAQFAGDFANTQGEVANQTRIANAELENSKILLGEELMPLQVEWVNFQRNVLIPTLVDTAAEIGGISDLLKIASDSTQDLNFRMESLGAVMVALMKKLNPVTQVVGLITAAFRELEVVAARAVRSVRDLLASPFVFPKITLPKFPSVRLPGFAHGGTIQPGQSGVVGEQGPEIISPRGGAKITPAHQSRGGGGGVVVNVEFSGVVGDPTAVAEQIQDLIELYGRTNNAF